MQPGLLAGAIAGAAGTVALDAITYGDMVLRGRPQSTVPAEVAGTLAVDAGLHLAGKIAKADEVKQHRQSGLGALTGYVVGIGVGTLYGLLRPQMDTRTRLLAGLAWASRRWQPAMCPQLCSRRPIQRSGDSPIGCLISSPISCMGW